MTSTTCQRFFQCLSCLVVSVLTAAALLFLGGLSLVCGTQVNVETMSEQLILFQRNPLAAAAGAAALVAVVLGVCWLARWMTRRIGMGEAQFARLMTAASMTGVLVMGLWWIFSFSPNLMADQKDVWNLATGMVEHNAKLIQDYAFYIEIHPYQGCLALWESIFIRLFGVGGVRAWQIASLLLAVAAVGCLCGLTRRISGSTTAQAVCAEISLLFIPLWMYATYVYGTLPSVCMAVCALYCAVRAMTDRPGWWVACTAALFVCITLHSSMRILLIALLLTALAQTLSNGRSALKKILLPACAMALAVTVLTSAWQALFFRVSGLPESRGLPITAWIAMGIRPSGVSAPGGYDFTDVNAYLAADGDYDKAAEIIWQDICSSVAQYRDDPALMSGLVRKQQNQWADPWFGALTMNHPAIRTEPRWLALSMGGGGVFRVMNNVLRSLATAVYFVALPGLLVLIRRRKWQVWALLPATVFLGGFLLQLMWETKSRYCFPYMFLLLPVAAVGMAAVQEQAEKLFRKPL